MQPLKESPYLERFIELAAKVHNGHALALLSIQNETLRRVSMERAILNTSIWESVSEAENWGSIPRSSRDKYYNIDQTWKMYFKLTMEDIRDGESIEGAMETILR